MMNIDQLTSGLLSSQPFIPTWFTYDETGSSLYEECTNENPYYYIHREERQLLKLNIKELIGHLGDNVSVVDLGSGNAEKTRIVLNALLERQETVHYVPVDISAEFLKKMCKQVQQEYGERLMIEPISGDWNDGIDRIATIKNTVLVLWFANMQMSYLDMHENLCKLSRSFKDHDVLLTTYDANIDNEKIEKAYMEPRGIRKRFYENGVHRLNKEFNGNIDLQMFELESEFVLNESNDDFSFFSVWLRCKDEYACTIDGLKVSLNFTKNGKLLLHGGDGYSYKQSRGQVEHLLMSTPLEELMGHLGENVSVVDLGSGNAEKTRIVLNALLERQETVHYVPVDISAEYLKFMCRQIKEEYGERLSVEPIAGDWDAGIKHLATMAGDALLLWFGNLQMPYFEMHENLQKISKTLKDRDFLLTTYDANVDNVKIEKAYMDPNGFGKRLYLNGVHRLNKDFNGNLDLQMFELESKFVLEKNSDTFSFFTVWLRCKCDYTCSIDGLKVSLNFPRHGKLMLHSGDGVSYKHSLSQVEHLLMGTPLEIVKKFHGQENVILTLIQNKH